MSFEDVSKFRFTKILRFFNHKTWRNMSSKLIFFPGQKIKTTLISSPFLWILNNNVKLRWADKQPKLIIWPWIQGYLMTSPSSTSCFMWSGSYMSTSIPTGTNIYLSMFPILHTTLSEELWPKILESLTGLLMYWIFHMMVIALCIITIY